MTVASGSVRHEDFAERPRHQRSRRLAAPIFAAPLPLSASEAAALVLSVEGLLRRVELEASGGQKGKVDWVLINGVIIFDRFKGYQSQGVASLDLPLKGE